VFVKVHPIGTRLRLRSNSAPVISLTGRIGVFISSYLVQSNTKFKSKFVGKNTISILFSLASVLKIDELVFEENVVLKVSLPPTGADEEQRTK
jgi:hypothetical protein